MTVFYYAPVDPYQARSGGTRKLADHVEILKAHGIDAEVRVMLDRPSFYKPDDIIVMPEVYGEAIAAPDLAPRHIRRMPFVQNGYLLDTFGVNPNRPHPWYWTPSLIGVLTESDHSTELVKLRCPDLDVPIIRTHSCGNAINGKPRGLDYGPWPRRKVVMYFGYKHSQQNRRLFTRNMLPHGWEFQQLEGSDEEVNEALMTGAIFCAPNANEGMCAPTQEAQIAGAVVVCWPGGPSRDFAHDITPGWSYQIAPEVNTTVGGPIEYLDGRAVIAPQDDVPSLLRAIFDTATEIDSGTSDWPERTREYSEWHQKEYSREQEVEELVSIMRDLGA